MEARQTVGYRLVKCGERAFATKLVIGKVYPEKSVAFHFACKINPSEKNRLSFIITVNYTVEGHEVFKLESETVFELMPLEQAIELLPDGKIVDHVGIVPTLLGISYSSTRGMIAIRTAGTGLDSFPAPIVNTVDVVKKMSEIK